MNKQILSLSAIMASLILPHCLFSAAGPTLSHWWQSAQTKAGFVLPYYKNKHNGNTYYIFGQEKGGRDKGTYSPFGGKADRGECHPVITAAREAYEEMNSAQTMHMNQQSMQTFIDVKNQNTEAIIATKQPATNALAFYLTDFGHNKIHNQFLPHFHGNSEIDKVAEIREDRLIKALQNTKKGQPIQVEATIWSNGQRIGNRIITLRPLTSKLKKWFQGNQGTPGKSNRIHFY